MCLGRDEPRPAAALGSGQQGLAASVPELFPGFSALTRVSAAPASRLLLKEGFTAVFCSEFLHISVTELV